jgi:hypothetical protein
MTRVSVYYRKVFRSKPEATPADVGEISALSDKDRRTETNIC